jgi:hypothetical protein
MIPLDAQRLCLLVGELHLAVGLQCRTNILRMATSEINIPYDIVVSAVLAQATCQSRD